MVEVLDLTVDQGIRALQQINRALALQVLDEVFDGGLTIVQGDEIEKLEDSWITQRAQFGVGKTAAHDHLTIGMVFFDPLPTTKSGV